MFDLDRFIEDCRAAIVGPDAHKAMREIVARAVSDPTALMAGIGVPERAAARTLYRGADLTILDVIWGPRMTIMPHNHNMWATIGVYTGREDNIFWRRLATEDGEKLEAAGARSLGPRDVFPLGRDLIHIVTNPVGKLTGAIHVYGGDFFAQERSEWEPEGLTEQRYDVSKTMRLFEESNAAVPR
jgi:predicted metal-dependent enzyme (double-stranded beta helix superfamily)